MEKPNFDPEEWVVSLNDVKQLYMSMWKRVLKWALIGAAIAFLGVGIGKAKYKAEANFKEGIEKSGSDTMLKELMGGFGGQQPQAASIMKSYQVLKPLTEKMGLQISPAPSGWLPMKVLRRYKESWRAEKGLPLEEMDAFAFEDVHYEQENSLSFHLVFTEDGGFTVYDERKKGELGKGKLGEPFSLEDAAVQFTVKKTPKKLKIGSYYPFSVQHWGPIVGALRGQVKIKTDKDNKSIINITFSHRDRYFAADLVNELMRQYQAYLKREFSQLAQDQLTYLEGKQEQTFGQMGTLIDQHAAYLSRNIEENGFVGLDQETGRLLEPHQEMYKNAFAIDVELSRLDQVEKENKSISIADNSPFSHVLGQIGEKIKELKEQRDLIELSLTQTVESSLQMRKEELYEVRDRQLSVGKLLQEIDLGKEISSCDWNPALALWAKNLSDPEEKEDFVEYLENYARVLSMREKMLQERFFYSHTPPAELEGIDLPSAQKLFLEYNNKLDAAEAQMLYYEKFQKEIQNPQFDLASLSSILKDPFCQKIIEEVAKIGQYLQDEKHHTVKEGERWREEIALYRRILFDHLHHLHQVEELNLNLIRQKMSGLQSLILNGINRQLSVLHEQFSDSIKERRKALILEKELLKKKMRDMRDAFAGILPEKWRFEKWLGLKTLMIGKVMETMTEVVESKTIAMHLHHVASKPLDIALVPIYPEPPKLYLLSFVGAFVFAFFGFFITVIRQLIQGFPVSLEKLKALQFPALGKISSFCDGPQVEPGTDLDTLRNIGLFAEGGKVIGLIGGKGPDYTYALAENLARRFAKSIVLRCDFNAKFRKEEAPGLLQLWKGEIGELPIRKGKGFDYILPGGYTPFGTEIIQSPQFKQLIEVLKKNYDWVFLYSRAPLSSAEPLITLNLCDKAVVTVSNEKTEELTPFVDWGYDQNCCRITFITER